MKRSELEQTLRELGHLSVDPLDDTGVERVAERWRAAASGAPGNSTSLQLARTRKGSHRVRRPAVVGATALVLAAAASVAVIVSVHSPTPSDTAVVAEAQGVTVILPNGEVIAPLAGEGLPIGAIVEAGANARGRIGDSVLVPRSRYIVGRNGLEIATSEPPENTPQSSGASGSVGADSGPAEAPPTSSRPASTAAPTPSTSTPASTTSSPAETAITRLSVSAAAKGKKARVSWSRVSNTAVKQYVVIRVRSWNGSTLPKGKRIATVRSGGALTAIDQHPQPGTFYVVAALGAKRKVLAIGSVQAPTIPSR